jgi:mono/diheme cytochrome c family protein/glucose/arabinose dehydrogenase
VNPLVRAAVGAVLTVIGAAAVSLDSRVDAGQQTGRGARVAPRADDPLNAEADWSAKPPLAPLAPAEQVKRFWLPPGYRIEPVLADPDIDNPGQIAFDGNGRMFVIELRGYEQTADGQDLLQPVGRISVHEDRDGDGVYEHHRVFVDKLLLPRLVLPFGANSILALENDGDELWRFTDTDGDGTADEKVVFTTSFGRGGALGGQPSGLVWALDNWLYSTVNAFRVRWTPTGVIREPTGATGSQWGATQDDDGKMWFQAGISGLPSYFQFPVHYGTFNAPDQLDPELNTTWGAPILVGDIAGGLPATRMPDGSLMYVTAGAGNDIFRGDRLPKDLIGDYLYGEIVARIVRRLKVVKREGLTRLENAYLRSEFIRSLDPLFRPIDMATGPDGTLYVVDMYRGVVEWAPGARTGTYLRQKIVQYQMDRVRTNGRVWRVTYDDIPRDRTRPRMLAETAAQLVRHLGHPNGWWRDTAQQLLVLKQDRGVVPALERMVRPPTGGGGNVLARLHALWTLEGLGALTPATVRLVMSDSIPRMRQHGIRASETLYKRGDRSFAADYRALAGDPDPDVVIQALLTMSTLRVSEREAAVRSAIDSTAARGVQFIATSLTNAAAGRGGPALPPDQQRAIDRGRGIYGELCVACHGDDGRGTPHPAAAGSTRAPSLAGSSRVTGHRDYIVKALLHGITGQLDGRSYSEVMLPMGANSDEWIADVASYVRTSFGNSSTVVLPGDVSRLRSETARRAEPWTVSELEGSLPVALVADDRWKTTASHASSSTANVFTLAGWSTGATQQAGMWFQIELPAPEVVTEVQFTSPPQGGGRAGPPPAQTYPRAYRVEVSPDGSAWTPVVGDARGAASVTSLTFAPLAARFVRIILSSSASEAPAWAMQRLRLFRPGGAR